MTEIIRNNERRLERFLVQLERHDPRKNLAGKREKISALHHRIIMAQRNNLERHKKRLLNVTGLLHTVSPLATLARGYAIVKNEQTGDIIRKSGQVQPGDDIEILLHKGSLNCEVVKTK